MKIPEEKELVKVRASFVPEEVEWYLTADKIYEGYKISGKHAIIFADDNEETVIGLDICLHLNNKSWEIVE